MEKQTTYNQKEASRAQDLQITAFLNHSLPAEEVVDLALDKPVLELCNHCEQLTAPKFEGYNGSSGYCGVHSPATLTIDLGELAPNEERDLGLIQLLLFDPVVDRNHGKGNERRYHYRLLVAEDFASKRIDKDRWEWRVLFDSSHSGWCRNWQLIHLKTGLKQIRYIRIHCLNGMKNSGFHIVRLRAYSSRVAQAVDFEQIRAYLQDEARIVTPNGSRVPIDPSRSMNHVLIDPQTVPIEVGDGFPLSKRLADTMNRILLLADKEKMYVEQMVCSVQHHKRANQHRLNRYKIEKRHLEGINTTITKKAEAFTNPKKPNEVLLTLTDIHQILDSIVDDIAIVERDPKNMERVVLDPVTTQLKRGFVRDRNMIILSILTTIISLYLLLF